MALDQKVQQQLQNIVITKENFTDDKFSGYIFYQKQII